MDGATGGLALWSRPQSGEIVNSDMGLTEAAKVKESKELVSLPPKQADWEKQMESADQKQAELFHFQWKLIREQLGTLSRELANSRQELEALKTLNARREARDNDMNRAIQMCQSTVEKESQSRRTQEEESTRAVNQIKGILEQEKTDRARALQSLENEVELQLKSVRQQQQIQAESEKSLGSRLEGWLLELRSSLEREVGSCNVKLDELAQASTQLNKSLGMEKAEREKLVQGLNDQVTQLKLGFQSKDEEDKRNFAENREEFKSVRQALEKECRERGVLDKVLQEAIEALHLEKTESRARHSSLSGQMQVENNKLANTTQALDARLEEHREAVAAWEAEFLRHKNEYKDNHNNLRTQSTDSLESLEALLRREFKEQFESIKEQSRNNYAEFKSLSQEWEKKFGRRVEPARSLSTRSASPSISTTPTMSVNAPSTATKVTVTESGAASPGFAFAMGRSPSSVRTLSPNSFGMPRSTTPTPASTAASVQDGSATPISPSSRSTAVGPARAGSPPVRQIVPGSIKVTVPVPAGSPVSSPGMASSPGAAPVGQPMLLPGETRQGAMARAVQESAAAGKTSPTVGMRPGMVVSTRAPPGAYAFRG